MLRTNPFYVFSTDESSLDVSAQQVNPNSIRPDENCSISKNAHDRFALAPFPLKGDVEIWFIAAETRFYNAVPEIKQDKVKFEKLVASLPFEALERIKDVMLDRTNSPNKYERAKGLLLAAFALSQEENLNQLLTIVDLGTYRPSELLIQMRRLAKGNISEQALTTLWLTKLPEHIRGMLGVRGGPLDELAIIADRAISLSIFQAASVTSTTNNSSTDETLAKILNHLEVLAVGNSRHRGRNDRLPSNQQTTNDTECYYHKRFGKDARNCKPFCKHYKTLSKN